MQQWAYYKGNKASDQRSAKSDFCQSVQFHRINKRVFSTDNINLGKVSKKKKKKNSGQLYYGPDPPPPLVENIFIEA